MIVIVIIIEVQEAKYSALFNVIGSDDFDCGRDLVLRSAREGLYKLLYDLY